MSRKIYWGLGTLALLIIGFFIFLLIHNQSTIKKLKQEFAETQKMLNNQDSEEIVTVDSRPPPPGKSFEGGGHWHGDEWHDAPHEPSPVAKERRNTVISHQQPELLNINIPEPGSLQVPEGHYYVSDGKTGHYYLDESGQPILMRKGEPFTTIETFIGFAPTKEVYIHYLELSTQYEEAKNLGNSLRASELKSEIDQIIADNQGELPAASSVIVFEADVTEEERQAALKHADKIEDIMLKQALIDMGLTHLYRVEYIPSHLH